MKRYHVQVWTAWDWGADPIPPSIMQAGESKEKFVRRKVEALEQIAKFVTKRDERVELYATRFEEWLRRRCEDYEPVVKSRRVNQQPQLRFGLELLATDDADAESRAKYWIIRAARALKYRSLPLGKVDVKAL